jgi:hypothetical protein
MSIPRRTRIIADRVRDVKRAAGCSGRFRRAGRVRSVTDPSGSQERWRAERRFLNANRYDLARTAQELYPRSWRVAGTPMLARPEWIPEAPVPLDRVALSWRPAEPSAPPFDGSAPETAAAAPLRADGLRFGCYADALAALSRPALFEDRACYRLLDVRALPGAASLEFGPGHYFEMINTGEAVAHEYAAAALADDGARAAGLPLRSLIGDPTDLPRRPVLAAVATLVLRADRARAQMILHWRDPARVATGGGLYQVAPVGMFQPSHDAPWNRPNDFSLWRSIVRELSEELLGSGEDYHSDTAPIDYENWPLYAALAEARRAGTLGVHWLGLGMDPLTLVVDMLTVAVFDSPVFDAMFAGLVPANAEGRLVSADDATGTTVGIPFTAAAVERFTTAEPMQSAGSALLRLAWAHRDTLLAR